MEYRYNLTYNGADADGLTSYMQSIGFEKIRPTKNGLSASVFRAEDRCRSCMCDTVLDTLSDKIKKSEYGGGIEKISYKPTLLSRGVYALVIGLVKLNPEYITKRRKLDKIMKSYMKGSS